MKKILLALFMAFCASSMFAQNIEAIRQSQERLVKILKLEAPAPCKNDKINALATECTQVAEALKTNATLLHKYYYALNGKDEAGNENADVVRPTAEEVVILSKSIQEEAKSLKKASELLPDATKALKDIKNPMQLKSAKKSYDYSQEVLQLATEENAAEVKLVADLIEQATK